MTRARTTFLAAGLLFAVACGGGGSGSDSYQAAVPTYSGLSAEVSGAAAESSSLTTTASQDSVGVSAQALTSGIEYLPAIRDAVKGLNEGIRSAFAPVEQLVVAGGKLQAQGQTQVYGPYVQAGYAYQLTVTRIAGNRYAWKLEVKKDGDATATFVKFAAGSTFRNAADEDHRGRGTIGIDADAYKSVVATFPGAGKLFVAFSHSNARGSKTLLYGLKAFSADTTKWQPVDAVFYAHKLGSSGVTTVRVIDYSELPDFIGTPDQKELLLARARYNPGVGGRAEVAVAGGDVGAGRVVFGVECWDAAEALLFKATADCQAGVTPGEGSCSYAVVTGSAAACKVPLANGQADHVAPGTAENTGLEPDAPASDLPTLPQQMPSGES